MVRIPDPFLLLAVFCGTRSGDLKGDLAFRFFGYPTLYGLDSTTHEKFTHIIDAKRLKRKYRFMKNEYDVYRKLEEIYWREYPCVAVNLNDTDSTIFIFVNIDDYNKVIVKNQEQ